MSTSRAPGRQQFFSLLHGVLGDETPGIVAVIIVQIRRVRNVNLEFGYGVGDGLLVEMAARIEGCLRACDHVVRLSPTEFGLILPKLRTAGQPQLAVSKIQRACAEPLEIEKAAVSPRLTFGMSLFPAHERSAEGLLQCADRALSLGRESGRDVMLYEDDVCDRTELMGMESDLEGAIEHNGLDSVYQPKIELGSGSLTGVEMLTRWKSRRFGMVSPERFIGLAERSGLIVPLTLWALRRALRECQSWAAGLPGVGVAVNLSTRLLSEPQLPAIVEQTVGMWDLEPGMLTLEVTESALMTEPDLAMRTLDALHNMGVRLSIDDFGTGYSSLAYLKRLPVDELKIDKSFVMNMGSDEDDRRIVQSVVDLADNFDLMVVAEGIENVAVLEKLAAMGCQYAQGYFIAKPMAAEELGGWLAASPWRTQASDGEAKRTA